MKLGTRPLIVQIASLNGVRQEAMTRLPLRLAIYVSASGCL